LPTGVGGDGDEHMVELHQGSARCQFAVQGASRPLDTIIAKTHHDFVNRCLLLLTKIGKGIAGRETNLQAWTMILPSRNLIW